MRFCSAQVEALEGQVIFHAAVTAFLVDVRIQRQGGAGVRECELRMRVSAAA